MNHPERQVKGWTGCLVITVACAIAWAIIIAIILLATRAY